ncbi:flagellar type III secretion system pore protein FliP [Carboxydichorda subterranea]|uniref:flagellar type III secretion system pore protein FliP n=1 Tax=Carboxydichorda subterranea TaxID=3109565 RepID=UPI0038577DD5
MRLLDRSGRYHSRLLVGLLFLTLVWAGSGAPACAAAAAPAPLRLPSIELRLNGQPPQAPDLVTTLQILVLLTVLSLAPAILVMVTSFTRIVIVLSFVRNALSTPQVPPNQVLVGLALFLTFFTMHPTWQSVYSQAIAPYLQGEIGQQEALRRGELPLRDFMFRNTREKDLELFVSASGSPRPERRDQVPTYLLIPAFVISELKTAFQMGFLIFVPFLVIDMIVASTLMSMGMLMLPPVMISLPFKVLLFVMVDGWHLVTRALLTSVK